MEEVENLEKDKREADEKIALVQKLCKERQHYKRSYQKVIERTVKEIREKFEKAGLPEPYPYDEQIIIP